MHSHGVLKNGQLNVEVCEQLDQERMSNCSNENFLLDLAHELMWNNLQSEHFFTGALATYRSLLFQYDLAK
jgi:hypothetical protein